MSRVRIPVELHRALGDYFERVWNCSFALQGEPCAASEIFHRNGFLPFIVELASRKSQRIFNRPIDAQTRACANHRAVSDLCLSLDADFHAHPRRLAAAGRLSASG